MTGTALVGVGVPDAPEGWASLGFTVVDGAVTVANGSLLLGREGVVVSGPVGGNDLDGIPLSTGTPLAPVDHACGAFDLDHLVLLTDSLERTSAAVEATLGLPRRRLRETDTVRQAFHRFADAGGVRGCIVEVVESERVTGASVMGAVFDLADLHGWAERVGPEVTSTPKPATQPGRFISTVRGSVGLGTAVALMTPG